MKYEDTLVDTNFQKSEIGSMKWLSYREAVSRIRPYNIEKLELLKDIHQLIDKKIIF
jgi:hypothetical protein